MPHPFRLAPGSARRFTILAASALAIGPGGDAPAVELPEPAIPGLRYYHPPEKVEPRTIEADICIYGGCSAGVIAAVQADRMGKRAVLLEFGRHLGGLSSGGLSHTDGGEPSVCGGIAREFYEAIGQAGFRPSQAEAAFEKLLAGTKVEVHRLAHPATVEKDGPRIVAVTMEDGFTVRARLFESGADPQIQWGLDTNNHHLFNGAYFIDFVGGNYGWPDATWLERERIFQAHANYQIGLMWFLANSDRIPEPHRSQIRGWGLPRDEYVATGGWTHQLYIREGRRMVGDYVMTQHNCQGREVPADPVGLASYNMDSHHCQMTVVDGAVRNEGNVEVGVEPYPIAYRALVPKRGECTNLLVPVAVSSSHIAFGSIRMEPVFMLLGQAAATAAAQAIDGGVAVQDVPYDPLRRRLLADGQVLEYRGPPRLQAGPKAAATPAAEPEPTGGAVPRASRTPPNILLIVADDLGYETLGCYGGQDFATPHLDRLAAQGMRFRRAYTSPVCTPSRMSLSTGTYVTRHGYDVVLPEHEGSREAVDFRDRWATYPQLLRAAGYETSVTGKWQLGPLEFQPEHCRDAGFDSWCVWQIWHDDAKTERHWKACLNHDGRIRDDVADRFGPDVLAEYVIDQMRAAVAAGRPFSIHHNELLPHEPLLVRWPKRIQAGAVAEDLVDMADLFPTICDLAGVALPATLDLDGISFATRVHDGTPSVREWVTGGIGGKVSLFDGRWRLNLTSRQVIDARDLPREVVIAERLFDQIDTRVAMRLQTAAGSLSGNRGTDNLD
jgi:hypothetical protein